MTCLTKTLKIVTELVKGVRPSLSFAKENVEASFKYLEKLARIVDGKFATDWSRQIAC